MRVSGASHAFLINQILTTREGQLLPGCVAVRLVFFISVCVCVCVCDVQQEICYVCNVFKQVGTSFVCSTCVIDRIAASVEGWLRDDAFLGKCSFCNVA